MKCITPDRSIQEKDFDHIQIDRIKEMKHVACNFRTDQENLSQVKFAIMAANNHYGGFSPGAQSMSTDSF
jgi:hypothetical protein